MASNSPNPLPTPGANVKACRTSGHVAKKKHTQKKKRARARKTNKKSGPQPLAAGKVARQKPHKAKSRMKGARRSHC